MTNSLQLGPDRCSIADSIYVLYIYIYMCVVNVVALAISVFWALQAVLLCYNISININININIRVQIEIEIEWNNYCGFKFCWTWHFMALSSHCIWLFEPSTHSSVVYRICTLFDWHCSHQTNWLWINSLDCLSVIFNCREGIMQKSRASPAYLYLMQTFLYEYLYFFCIFCTNVSSTQ